MYFEVPLVVVLSSTGLSARLVAKYRPNAPIMCITEHEAIRRQCLFTRGVVGYIREPNDADADAIKRALDWAVSLDWVKMGEDVTKFITIYSRIRLNVISKMAVKDD